LGLIGKNLSFGAQFGLNWEDWNFKRPNFIFTNLIDWNQGQNRKKIEVFGLIKGQIEEIHGQWPICKKRHTLGVKLTKIGGEIE